MIDISKNDTWEVTWGGMSYNDIADSSTMQPRYSEVFLTLNEAREFAFDKRLEGHPRVWIEYWEVDSPPVRVPINMTWSTVETENRVLKYRLQLVYGYIRDISQSGDLDGLRDWLKEIDEDEAKAIEATMRSGYVVNTYLYKGRNKYEERRL